jgi:hypothetical protein
LPKQYCFKGSRLCIIHPEYGFNKAIVTELFLTTQIFRVENEYFLKIHFLKGIFSYNGNPLK